MINYRLLFCISIVISMSIYADSMLNSYYQDNVAQSSVITLDKNYAVNKTFMNINQVASSLDGLGFNAVVKDQQTNSPVMINIKSNTNVRDFINSSAKAFGYAWIQDGNSIIFTATNPIKPKLTASETKSTTVAVLSPANKSVAVAVTDNWTYTPSDKYVSVTFARWAKQAGYQLVWQADNDFEIQSSGSLSGGFKHSVNEVLKSFAKSDHPLKAEWYKNNVVVISNFGN